MTWTLTLPGIPMSMNERERTAFWGRKKELDTLIETITVRAAHIPPATGKRRVEVVIEKGKRSRKRDDPYNRDSRAKAIMDALVRCKLLVDDSDEWLDHIPVAEFRGDEKRTHLTISESPA